MDESCDLIEGNRPYVFSKSVGNSGANSQYGAGYARYECNDNEIIVQSEFRVADVLRDKPEYYNPPGNGTE